MIRTRARITTLLAGIVAGALVLGLGGRLAMAALTLATRSRPQFSLGGSLEVVILGMLYGSLGGLVLISVRTRWPRRRWSHGVLLGAALCGVAWLSSPVGRQTALDAPVGIATVVALSVLLFLLYGVVAVWLASSWAREE